MRFEADAVSAVEVLGAEFIEIITNTYVLDCHINFSFFIMI